MNQSVSARFVILLLSEAKKGRKKSYVWATLNEGIVGGLYLNPLSSLILPAGFDLQQVALSQPFYQIQAL